MAYKGSFINFVANTASVVEQLPRAAGSTGLIIYKSKDSKGAEKLVSVKRARVKAYLDFFIEHHHYFQHGILNKYARGEDDKYVVPPIKGIDVEALNNLPEEEAVPAGVDVRDLEDEEDGDEEVLHERAKHDVEASGGGGGGGPAGGTGGADEGNSPRDWRRRVGISSQLLGRWLRWRSRTCLLYTSPSPRDRTRSRMPSSA